MPRTGQQTNAQVCNAFPKKIPRPQKEDINFMIKAHTPNQLVRQAMMFSHDDFGMFTKLLRDAAKKYLDVTKSSVDAQSPVKWETFKNHVIRAHPEMQQYEGCWPIEICMQKYLIAKSARDRHRCVFTNKHSNQGPDENAFVIPTHSGDGGVQGSSRNLPPRQTAPAAPRTSGLFVGRTPPRRFGRSLSQASNLASIRSTGSSSVSPSAGPSINRTVSRRVSCSAPLRTIQPVGQVASSLPGKPLNQSTTHDSTLQVILPKPEPIDAVAGACPVGCFRCGFLPPVHLAHAIKIRDFLTGMNELLPIFTAVGINNDRHFEFLLKRTDVERAAFFRGLVTRNLTDFQCEKLLRRFSRYLKTSIVPAKRKAVDEPVSTPNGTRIKLEFIARPSPDEEARLIQSTCPSVELREATNLNEELYSDLVKTIERLSGDYTSGSKPFHPQDDENWNLFVKSVCDECGVLEGYEGAWPIEFYIKRQLQQQASERNAQEVTHDAGSQPGPSSIPDNDHADNIPDTQQVVVTVPRHEASTQSSISEAENCSKGNVGALCVPCTSCPYIPFVIPGFSPKVGAFLQSCGMEELLPAFTSIGIYRDADLDHLRSMEGTKRDSFFNTLEAVKLNEFQRFTLKVAFR